MRATSPQCAATLDARGARPALVLVVESWLGARYLGKVPVVTGTWSVTEDESRDVPGSLTFDVPLLPQWLPLSPLHPLANYGQQLRIKVGVRLAGGGTEWISLGRWLVIDAVPVEDTIQVQADSLERLVVWDRLLAPVRITGPTRADGLRSLMDKTLPVLVTATSNPSMSPLPVDRERWQGIRDLIDAWPARSYVDEQGTFTVADPWPNTVGASVWSSDGRTISTEPAGNGDETIYNGYSVSTVPEDGTTEPVTEVWWVQGGPMAWGPPYGRRPGFYASPTLPPNRDVLRSVAQSLTLRSVRRGRAIKAVCLPDPRIVRGDVVRIVHHETAVDLIGRVSATTLTRTALTLTVAEGV